ncbi:MAG: hypothetical protein GY869_03120 [Planctomycetes bacterium]|nr:hypothetical protein [Planctomycetota bacterium]
MNNPQPSPGNPNNTTFYPLNLGLKHRAELLLYLVEGQTLTELYTQPFQEILKNHKHKLQIFLKEIPGILASMLIDSLLKNEILKVNQDLTESQVIPLAIDNLINTNLLQRDDSLQQFILTDNSADPTFVTASQQLWDSGYPLIYQNIIRNKGDQLQKLFRIQAEGGFDFLGHLGSWTFKDMFTKSHTDCTAEQIAAVRVAKSLGVITLNGQMGNKRCCDQYIRCKESEDELSFCAEDSRGNCVVASDPCIPT